MKTKLVLWGYNANEEKVLLALQLRPEDNKVDIWTFPETVATDEFARLLMGDWRNDVEVAFPDGHQHIEQELSVTEDLLPEDIKVERSDIVQRAQTEWHFVVLSSKLNDLYKTELSELKDKVNGLSTYSGDIWNELKRFWGKVQDQVKERNLLRDHADILRDETNLLFDQMKELRSALDDDFRKISTEQMDKFMSKLESIEQKIADGVRLPALFDELKGMQRTFREIKLTREHRSKIWNRLDAAFKAVKEKRFGPSANSESSALERLTRRYSGLVGAINKMQSSIDRDNDELRFQQRKVDDSDGQLESQLRQAKINMTEERIRSKREKLDEMLKTREDLDRRIAAQKEKELKRQQKEEIEEAKVNAKEKIAKRIEEQAKAREGDERLEKAAEAINSPTVAKITATDIEEKVAEKTEAVAEVVEATKEAVAEKTEAAAEVIEAAKEAVGEKVADIKDKVLDVSEDAKKDVSSTFKAIGGGIVGAGIAALSTITEKVEDATEAITDAKEAIVKKVTSSSSTESETIEDEETTDGESLLEKAEDVVEDITEGLSNTFKAGATAIFGAGAAAVSALSGGDDSKEETETTKTNDDDESIVDTMEDMSDSMVDKVTDVVEDITEAATSTLKTATDALLGFGSAVAAKLSDDSDEVADTEDSSDSEIANVIADATAVSEVVEEDSLKK